MLFAYMQPVFSKKTFFRVLTQISKKRFLLLIFHKQKKQQFMKPLQMTLLAAIVSATLFSCSKIADKVSGGAISSGKCEIKASV